jgi:hypothetical protein
MDYNVAYIHVAEDGDHFWTFVNLLGPHGVQAMYQLALQGLHSDTQQASHPPSLLPARPPLIIIGSHCDTDLSDLPMAQMPSADCFKKCPYTAQSTQFILLLQAFKF